MHFLSPSNFALIVVALAWRRFATYGLTTRLLSGLNVFVLDTRAEPETIEVVNKKCTHHIFPCPSWRCFV